MIESMMAHYNQSVHKMLPVWSHYANENWCMIGYHSVSVISDAIIKGTTDVNIERALKACTNSSTLSYYDGIDSYMSMGYVPEDKSSSSVSKTLIEVILSVKATNGFILLIASFSVFAYTDCCLACQPLYVANFHLITYSL